MVAGIQDFRQEGPPGDIGAFQSTTTTIVHQFTFSGVTYIVAQRMGLRGWVLVGQGTDSRTVINIAILASNDGDTIAIRGFATAYSITGGFIDDQGKNNITLSLEKSAKLFKTAGQIDPIIYLTSVSGWVIEGGELDGNAANQAAPGANHPDGINMDTCNYCEVRNMYIHDCRSFGFFPHGTSVGCGIRNCHLTLNRWNAINLGGGTDTVDAYAIEDICEHSGDVEIATYALNSRILGNTCRYCDGADGSVNSHWGIGVEGGGALQKTIIAGNIVHHVKYILVTSATSERVIFADNMCWEWNIDGAFVSATDLRGNHHSVIDNIFNGIHAQSNGVQLNNAQYCLIDGNQINIPGNQCLGIGITSSNNDIINNQLTGGGVYGIIIDANCNYNMVKNNDMRQTNVVNDLGTGTIFNTIRASFIKELGTAAWIVAAAAPMGIDIDAANEGAVAKIKLPTDLFRVVRIKIWGIAQLAEADHMMLLMVAGAGNDNETWNAEAITPAAKASDTVNFANLDVVQWTFTAVDDADIGDLKGADFLQLACYYNAAAGGDINTDLLLMGESVEIEYV